MLGLPRVRQPQPDIRPERPRMTPRHDGATPMVEGRRADSARRRQSAIRLLYRRSQPPTNVQQNPLLVPGLVNGVDGAALVATTARLARSGSRGLSSQGHAVFNTQATSTTGDQGPRPEPRAAEDGVIPVPPASDGTARQAGELDIRCSVLGSNLDRCAYRVVGEGSHSGRGVGGSSRLKRSPFHRNSQRHQE
jgi:hypothetical protein